MSSVITDVRKLKGKNFGGGGQWHNVHIKLLENRATDSKAETEHTYGLPIS
jgi:hypothetical protein